MTTEQNERMTLQEGNGENRVVNHHMYASFHTLKKEWPVHWHYYYEIEIIAEGEGLYVLNGEEHILLPGMAFLLTPTDFHRVVPRGKLTLWNITFDEEMISPRQLCALASSEIRKSLTLPPDTLRQLCTLAGLLSVECRREDGGCCRELCGSLLCIYMRSCGASLTQETANITGIRKALLYLNVHFRENPSLSQAAAQAGFHPHHFSKMFKRATGENYIVYLNSLRTEYAKMLLSKGITVTDACFQSGFGSMSHFFVTFKRHTGCSPNEYKKQFLH